MVLEVRAEGTPPLQFQWHRGGRPLQVNSVFTSWFCLQVFMAQCGEGMHGMRAIAARVQGWGLPDSIILTLCCLWCPCMCRESLLVNVLHGHAVSTSIHGSVRVTNQEWYAFGCDSVGDLRKRQSPNQVMMQAQAECRAKLEASSMTAADAGSYTCKVTSGPHIRLDSMRSKRAHAWPTYTLTCLAASPTTTTAVVVP